MTNWDHRRCRCVVLPAQPTKKEEAMTEFDPSKPVMTRDGRKARIICTDRTCLDAYLGSFPIVALVDDGECGTELLYAFNTQGTWVGRDSRCDLVNIPESKWMNLYDDPKLLADLNFYTKWSESRADADKASTNALEVCGAKRVAIVEWTESGEFITTAVEK